MPAGRAAYPLSVRQTIANMDEVARCSATPVDTTNEFRLIDANLSYHILNHEISVGKSEDWWGPGEERRDGLEHQCRADLCATHQSRRATQIPLLSKFLGPFRYEGIFGDLKGHRYPNSPWVHAEKINFKPTPQSRVRLLARRGVCRRRPRAADLRIVLAQL